MTEKEKLVELLDDFPVQMEWHDNEELADHLIANGLSTVVHCRDCKHYKPQNGSVQWNHKTPYCMRKVAIKVNPDDFCSFGEREVK